VARFRDSEVHEKSEVGLVTGLAWTEVGGSILTTEVQVLDGKGKLTITGQLGDVMQESAQAALSYIRGKALRSACSASSTAISTSTCMCRKAQSPKTAPPPASPWYGAGFCAGQDPSPARHRHDRRNHAARQGAAHRRIERKAARGALRAGVFEVILPAPMRKTFRSAGGN
jgi:ATP-dependent Lon protease